MHPGGPPGHARRGRSRSGDAAIWLGERLFTGPEITDTEILRMLLEEAAHILAPKLGHDFIRHDEALTAKLTALAAPLGEKPRDARCEADAVADACEKTQLLINAT